MTKTQAIWRDYYALIYSHLSQYEFRMYECTAGKLGWILLLMKMVMTEYKLLTGKTDEQIKEEFSEMIEHLQECADEDYFPEMVKIAWDYLAEIVNEPQNPY
ncbi:MAG: hypothetical protein QXM92_01625 [Candidatus Anstonellales archaeon]